MVAVFSNCETIKGVNEGLLAALQEDKGDADPVCSTTGAAACIRMTTLTLALTLTPTLTPTLTRWPHALRYTRDQGHALPTRPLPHRDHAGY